MLHFGDFPLKQQVFHSFPQKSGSGTLNKKYTAWRPHTDTLFSVYCKCCFIFISLLHEAVSHILDGVSKVSNSFLCFCIDVTWSVKSVTTINKWSPNTPRERLMCEPFILSSPLLSSDIPVGLKQRLWFACFRRGQHVSMSLPTCFTHGLKSLCLCVFD